MDRALGKIVAKCLQADAENRYSNVQQILQDLTRRDASRAKKPLMLLGIVGPLLVLLATCFFGARTIFEARKSTLSALRTEAKGSNELAATFAAKTLENEISRYFQVTNMEASDPVFLQQLKTTLSSEAVIEALDEIAAMGTPAQTHGSTPARARLLAEEEQDRLDDLLQQRLNQYDGTINHARQPRLASMFVTDTHGTIISIAYQNEEGQDETAGRKGIAKRKTTLLPHMKPYSWNLAIGNSRLLTKPRPDPGPQRALPKLSQSCATPNLGSKSISPSRIWQRPVLHQAQ